MMKKTDAVTILQITNNTTTVYGLGSDQQMYQWNILDTSWHLYSLQKEATEAGKSASSTPVTPPTTPPTTPPLQ